ncbi:MAG: hypothetical protein ACXQS8_06225 [Candidatus Helarchaeales archaeon]
MSKKLDDEIKQEAEISPEPDTLSQRKKILFMILFIIGIPLAYPTVFPLGLVCSGILIFQKNKWALIAGILLSIIQVSLLIYFGFFYSGPALLQKLTGS